MYIHRLAACGLILLLSGCQVPMMLQQSAKRTPFLTGASDQEFAAESPVVNEKTIALRLAVAAAAESRGDEKIAIQSYEELLELDPGNTQCLHRLALLHGKRGATGKSTELFKAALAKDTRNAELCCDYGYALYLAGDFDEASQQLRHAIELEPELNRARNILGMILARTNQQELAISEFSLARVPMSEAYANLALAMLLNGDAEAAERNIRIAESLRPSSELQGRLTVYRTSIQAIEESGSGSAFDMGALAHRIDG